MKKKRGYCRKCKRRVRLIVIEDSYNGRGHYESYCPECFSLVRVIRKLPTTESRGIL